MCWMWESIASSEIICSPRAILKECTRQKDFLVFSYKDSDSGKY